MYDRIELPRTGRWARHLLRLSATSNIEVDPQLDELAKEVSYDKSQIPQGMSWTKREYQTLQYALDWNGRCMIAYEKNNPGYARHVSAIAAKQLGSKRIMITTRHESLALEWSVILKKLFPDDGIAISNKTSDISFITGDETSSTIWFIRLRKELVEPKIIDTDKPDHMIVDLESLTQIEYDFNEVLQTICLEFMRTTIVLGCQDFWNNTREDHASATISMISHILDDYLKLNSFQSRIPHISQTSKSPMEYYRARGVRLDSIAFYEASGACFSLVTDKPSKLFRNVISSALISGNGETSRRADIYRRYQQEEHTECQLHGKTLEEIVEAALQGDKSCRESIERMKTDRWAKLKASAIYGVIRDTLSTEEKTLIVAKNPVIVRNLSAQLGSAVYDKNGSRGVQQAMLGNFSYPHPNATSFERPAMEQKFNRIKMLIVEDILDVDERTLEVADRVVITEFPYDAEIMRSYVELAQIFRYRMYFGTMRGTFEDYLSDSLIEPFT